MLSCSVALRKKLFVTNSMSGIITVRGLIFIHREIRFKNLCGIEVSLLRV